MVDRRQALILLAGLGGYALSPLPISMLFAADRLAPLARFRESLDVEAAARLGRAYLERFSGEADGERLLARILEGIDRSADMAMQLSQKVCADFAAGRVVELNDWQVSATEARIFAAVALTA